MRLFCFPMDKDKSFEVNWALMLGHPHQRIILPPSVEAKSPNGKTIGAKRSHDEGVDREIHLRLGRHACRRIRFFRYSSRGASFLFRRESCRLLQPTGKRYQRASQDSSLANNSSRRSPGFHPRTNLPPKSKQQAEHETWKKVGGGVHSCMWLQRPMRADLNNNNIYFSVDHESSTCKLHS